MSSTRRSAPQTVFVALVAYAALVACQGSAATPRGVAGAPTTSAAQVSASTAPSSSVTLKTVPPRTVAPTTTTTRPAPTTTTIPPDGPAIGTSGAQVLAIQQQLSSLGYWLGTPDGQFGSTTQQAVFALQKAAGLPRTGVADPPTMTALAAHTRPSARSTSGHVIEVDLAHQLVLIVTNGHLDDTLNTSTGGGYVYYDQGARARAITPTGQFTTTWEVDGTRVSSLGVLWRPKYFVGGIAIHGDTYVPPRPVSHGCVRVSNAAIDWIWSTNVDPIGTPVWVY